MCTTTTTEGRWRHHRRWGRYWQRGTTTTHCTKREWVPAHTIFYMVTVPATTVTRTEWIGGYYQENRVWVPGYYQTHSRWVAGYYR